MAGFICLCLTFTQTLWMLASGGRCRGLAMFDKVVALAIVGLHMGFFTPWFKKRKMERLGKYTYQQHSMASIAVSFVMTANSKYAHDNFLTGEVNFITLASSLYNILCPLHTISISIHYFDASIAATTINIPPNISCIEDTSPRSTKAQTAANTLSIVSMMLLSLALVSC